jgi:hypothetical protein
MDAVIRLAERAGSHPFFVAYQLALLRSEHKQTIEEQAVAFGLDLDHWSKLALRRMPANAKDLERIARAFGMEPEWLAEQLQLDLQRQTSQRPPWWSGSW